MNTKNQALQQTIQKLFTDSKKTYGYRRIHQGLLKEGILCCANTVASQMKNMGLRVRVPKNLRFKQQIQIIKIQFLLGYLSRKLMFHKKINEVWAGDITYNKSTSRKVLLSLCCFGFI